MHHAFQLPMWLRQVAWQIAAVILTSSELAVAADNAQNLPEGLAWDFIVAGAGTGGSACAARLAESGASVLLLEAGPWDEPWLYKANAQHRDREETVWGYPVRMPQYLKMQNSPEFRFRVAAGKVLGGSSTVHQDVYNRPPTREFEYFGLKSWNEARVAAAFKRLEADMPISWFGMESLDDVPDAQFIVLSKLLENLHLPFRARPHQDGSAGGSSLGWWFYRTCPGDVAPGLGGYGKEGCQRFTSYSSLVGSRNSTGSGKLSRLTTLPESIVKRVLFDGDRAIGLEVLRHGNLIEIYAKRGVVLAAGALGTPKILMLSGIGDPLDLQRIGVPVRLSNREVGNELGDHLGTFTWFMLRGDNNTKFEGSNCQDKEFFHTFFNLTEPHAGGDGSVDAEVRYFTGCNITRRTVDFGIEAVLLHPKSRGKVVVKSADPEVLPSAEFPAFWEEDFDNVQVLLSRVAAALGLGPEDLSASFGMPIAESVRKNSYMYQHFCCSARVALEGEPGVCDDSLRVRGFSGLYVSDASALPILPSSHTSAAVLLLAELAAENMLKQTSSHSLPERSAQYAQSMEKFMTSSAASESAELPTLTLPTRRGSADSKHRVELPIVGLGTGTIANQRLPAAVAAFIRMGGRHLDTAAMYDNYAEIRSGIEASGLRDLSKLVITGKMMPLGRDGVRKAVADALAGLGVSRLDMALLHWPGDISSGKLMHGKPAPPCAERRTDGTVSWHACRIESYRALLEERESGRVKAVGVSNFAPAHLDQLEQEGFQMPAVHQLEMHPFWRDDVLLSRHAKDGAKIMAFGVLGGAHTGAPLIRQEGFKKIGERFGKSSAQVLLRWAMQHGAAVITGSSSDAHMKENLDVFDFELTQEDMAFMNSNPPEAMNKMYGPKPEEIL